MALITPGLLDVEPFITLDRYQEILKLPEAAFNGLNKPDDPVAFECATIWSQSARDDLAIALSRAEEMRSQELGYKLGRAYIEDEEHTYDNPILLDWKYLIQLGTLTTADIEDAVALTLGDEDDPNDPVEFTVTTSVTVTTELKVYHPDTTYEIHPSSISITGGVATIKIPRSRLMLRTLMDDREDQPSYHENDNFETTVDVKRVYMDTTSGVEFIWVGCTDLAETTQRAYFRILEPRISKVYIKPYLTFTKGCDPHFFRTSYQAGRVQSISNEMRTVRLAHSLMANRPCACQAVQQYWEQDYIDTDVLTPYGRKAGAVDAWMADYRARVGAGFTVP